VSIFERVELAPPTRAVRGRARRRWPKPPRPAVLSALLLAVLSATVVLLNVAVNRGVSPFDEASHADYALRVAQGQLPAAGDTVDREILREWSCRRNAIVAGDLSREVLLPPCDDGPLVVTDFPQQGLQYNFPHPPLYYGPTGLGAKALTTLTGGSFFQAARLTGIGWLTAGLWVLLAALRRLGASWTLGTAVGALVALTPTVMHASSTVNNDAAALLAGSLALLVALRAVQGQPSWLAFGAVAAAVASLKVIFVVALVPAGVVILLRLLRAPSERRPLLRVLAAGVAGAVVPVLLWGQLQAGRGDADYANPLLGISSVPSDGYPYDATIAQLLQGWPPVAQPVLQYGLGQPVLILWVLLINLLVTAAPLVAFAASRHATGRDVGIGAALGLVAVPVFVQLHTYTTYGYVFLNLAPRYGLSILPALAVAGGHVVHGRRADRAVAVLAVLGIGAVVVGVLMGFAATG
jgi:hypothetical protein